jgi:hypothetical protein
MRTPRQAVRAALDTVNNVPRTCQFVVRGWLDAPSAGDFDGDGAADAEDGWKKEPISARRNDRNPPEGFPVYYSGGSQDNGHRALSLGDGKIRSTDAPTVGHVSTVPLDWPEKNWGLKYVGWSTTMDGVPIPVPVVPPKSAFKPPTHVSIARRHLKAALKRALRKKNTKRAALIREMLAVDLDR